ncbi:MAG TPA: DJ-1/PfpI family protein [Acidimicrobiales bacterium]
MTTIAIALFPTVEELDWAGPWDVLASWAEHFPDDGVTVFTVADTPDVIECAKGMRVLAHHTWDDVPPFDVLVYPGGQGTRPQLGDERIRERIRRIAAGDTLMTSVCTGSLVYGDAGLLDGRPATTHWAAMDELRAVGNGIDVREGVRWIDDGDVITAAGVSAGIDMALHLICRLHSEERARHVKLAIQYDPQPPV